MERPAMRIAGLFLLGVCGVMNAGRVVEARAIEREKGPVGDRP
jgi:hypothetical protein